MTQQLHNDTLLDHEDSCTSSGLFQDITLRNIEVDTMESEDEYKRLIPDEKRDGEELESNVEYRGGGKGRVWPGSPLKMCVFEVPFKLYCTVIMFALSSQLR